MKLKCLHCEEEFISDYSKKLFCARCARIRKGIKDINYKLHFPLARWNESKEMREQYDKLFRESEIKLIGKGIINAKGSDAELRRCAYCGAILISQNGKYCTRCLLEGFCEIHKETGRTNGWDKKVRDVVKVSEPGWRGQKCFGGLGGAKWF